MSRFLSLRLPLLFAFTLCLIGATGCGGGGKKLVVVKGKVVLPPKVTLVKEQGQADSIQITLTPADGNDANGAGGTANVDDFTFTLMGPKNKGVPAGKYKVAVAVVPYSGRPDAAKRQPELAAAFGAFAPGKTPLEVDISEEPAEQTITIDLEKKTVTK